MHNLINIYDAPHKKPTGPVILDLGCYLGHESKKLLDIYKPSLLISVDAVQESIDIVEQKARHYDQWRIDCCIVSNSLGRERIGLHRSWAMNDNYCAHRDGIDNFRELQSKRIKDIHLEPDIIKCDIEGGEHLIWRQFLDLPSLKILFLEIHGRNDVFYSQMMRLLATRFSLRFYELRQGQTQEMDYTVEIDNKDFVCKPGNYCQVLAERK